MNVEPANVFDETYSRYMDGIRAIDFLAKAPALGVERDNDSLLIPLYDRIYRLGANGIEPPGNGPLTPAVRVMICKYVLTCPEQLPELSDTLCTYREFKNSAPLVSYFANNTNKTLESAFGGQLDLLVERAVRYGAAQLDSSTYDVSLCFHAFPRIPVIMNFNDRDDMFPAACSILYHRSASLFLDMECLAMTGTLLSGKLLA